MIKMNDTQLMFALGLIGGTVSAVSIAFRFILRSRCTHLKCSWLGCVCDREPLPAGVLGQNLGLERDAATA